MRFIRLGRWSFELHRRALHATREPRPDPKCTDCLGRGGHGWITPFGDADWEDCHCVSSLVAFRIPLWPRSRRQYLESEPF
ncbi:hypothetical protein [Streptomyces lavendulocolor]|uniref:hypothetical protein n=1 Tax=Streptomyces lavendulocolor TaxID=67316 RepID=UPI0033C906D7